MGGVGGGVGDDVVVGVGVAGVEVVVNGAGEADVVEGGGGGFVGEFGVGFVDEEVPGEDEDEDGEGEGGHEECGGGFPVAFAFALGGVVGGGFGCAHGESPAKRGRRKNWEERK